MVLPEVYTEISNRIYITYQALLHVVSQLIYRKLIILGLLLLFIFGIDLDQGRIVRILFLYFPLTCHELVVLSP